jgi:hypothetical protein
MLAPWAIEEMAEADIKDERLNERLKRILSDLGNRPTASIPAACGGKAETTAAYRFFDNEKATYERVIDPHYKRTRQRMGEQKVVLLVQDTTEIDLSRPASSVEGAGPLDNSPRRGVFLHLMEAFCEDGTPLGAVWTKIWSRNEEELEKSPEEKRERRRTSPIEEKESIRWVEGLRVARETAAELPKVTCVCVADSEADIYELFAEPRGDRGTMHWLIRACQDRGLKAKEPGDSTQLYEAVSSAPVLFTQTISVRGRKAKTSCEKRSRRQPREDRTTEVEVRAATLQLRPPPRPDRKLPAVVVNVVLVREIETPEGDEPVEWILVTTLPIDDVEQVRLIIRYYCVRWMIEVLFRTLKSGCRVEERRFEHLDRLLPCAAVYLIVAWRTLFVCRLGRSCPDIDCEAIFEPSEWRAVYVAVHRRTAPKRPPPLGEMVRLIAQLGGYVNYANRRDPPGPQTLWLGMQRMHDLAWAWEAFGPGAKPNQKDV